MIGAKPANKEEIAHMAVCKEGPCIPCLSFAMQGKMPWAAIVFGVTYDHKKSGNKRRGHLFGFGSCVWHHLRHPMHNGFSDGTIKGTFRAYGPSLLDGSATFRDTYGTDDQLIELQARWLAGAVEWGE